MRSLGHGSCAWSSSSGVVVVYPRSNIAVHSGRHPGGIIKERYTRDPEDRRGSSTARVKARYAVVGRHRVRQVQLRDACARLCNETILIPGCLAIFYVHTTEIRLLHTTYHIVEVR